MDLIRDLRNLIIMLHVILLHINSLNAIKKNYLFSVSSWKLNLNLFLKIETSRYNFKSRIERESFAAMSSRGSTLIVSDFAIRIINDNSLHYVWPAMGKRIRHAVRRFSTTSSLDPRERTQRRGRRYPEAVSLLGHPSCQNVQRTHRSN